MHPQVERLSINVRALPPAMLITVYVPTKNRLALLTAAVESVIRQTHTDWELIVVDDGSTDGTAGYLADLCARDLRVRAISHGTSQGGAAARNAAITSARGDFVTGLDDDDSFTPDRLERFASAWRGHQSVGESPSCLYSQLNVLRHDVVVEQSHKPDRACFDDMFRENVVGNQIFAPRQHYIDAGLFRSGLPAWQDLEFFMRVLKMFGPARLVDAATYNWDDSPRSDRVSLKSEEKMRLAFDTVRQLHEDAVPRRTQMLYLQLFGRYYGVKPTLGDWLEFLRLGFWPRGCLWLLRNQIA